MARTMMDSAGEGHEHLFYVDADDDMLSAYQEQQIPFITGPRVRLGIIWNFLARRATGTHLMMGNDDLIFRDANWAERVHQELPCTEPLVGCCNDGINGAEHFAFPIVTRKWYELMGCFTAEVFTFGYHDTWIFDIASRLNNRTRYLEDVLIEHIHPTTGKRPADKTFRERPWGRDPAIWEETSGMREDIARFIRARL